VDRALVSSSMSGEGASGVGQVGREAQARGHKGVARGAREGWRLGVWWGLGKRGLPARWSVHALHI